MRIEFHSDTAKKNNEDIYGLTRRSAYVIDGASALTSRSFTPGGNDVTWMVQWWKRFLDDNLDNTTRTIQEILKIGIMDFNRDFGRFADIDSLEAHEQLSAGIGIVRKHGDVFEAYVLGDVEISLESKRGECLVVTDSSIKDLDSQVVDLMRRNHQREGQEVFKGFTGQELDLLIRNRSRMNTPGGYFILGHSLDAVDMGIYKEFRVGDIEKCLLATDGIVPLSLRYSRKSLLESIGKKGVREMIKELRGIEKSDSDRSRMGRLKVHDDATLVYLDFGLQP